MQKFIGNKANNKGAMSLFADQLERRMRLLGERQASLESIRVCYRDTFSVWPDKVKCKAIGRALGCEWALAKRKTKGQATDLRRHGAESSDLARSASIRNQVSRDIGDMVDRRSSAEDMRAEQGQYTKAPKQPVPLTAAQ